MPASVFIVCYADKWKLTGGFRGLCPLGEGVAEDVVVEPVETTMAGAQGETSPS